MMFKTYLTLAWIYITVVYGNIFGDGADDNWISNLYEDKMKGYNKEARPVTNPNHNTTVFFGLYLNNIDIDDHLQEMSVNAWSIMTWVDEHLTWDPVEYMNIERVHFDQTDIWTPDITVYNSADGEGIMPYVKVPVLADYNGRTYWFPPTHIKVKCDLDLSLWPSDDHRCMVRMGSWSHHGEQIDLQIIKHNDTTDVMMSNFEKNNHWELRGVKATREIINMEGHDSYVELNFTFDVKRLARTHATYITQSTFVVIIVILATYALPLHSFLCRLIMHLFALGALIGCYFMLFATLPANGGPIPFVVRYYSGTMILTTISLLATIFLTTRGCCASKPTSNLGKKVVEIVSSTPGMRMSDPSQQPYSQLQEENIDDVERAQAVNHTAAVSDDGGFTAHQVRRVVNFILLVLFSVAFFVDYIVLRSVAK
ncbi:Neuronal acetylcholine receptor subunit alpha-7 [Halocaridina rubra]|uniref:Neuronal acetylcholine receptor subunit alpha-7 n=1 Tax=Halocaridina rubra TaxID=373956 RepID=A0AAN8ZQR3_HALRR